MVEMRTGSVESRLEDVIRDKGAAHLTLFDPEKLTPRQARQVAVEAKKAGTDAAIVGGSTASSVYELDAIVKAVKSTRLPVILFPSDLSGISRYADAVFFMSLLNSSNPYYITGAQALGAPLVKRYRLEPIPLAYIVLGGRGSSVSFVGNANPIPYDKPELAAIYALAGEYLGMRFIYLEAGSGARKSVPPDIVKSVKRACRARIVVGGGITSPAQVTTLLKAGASIIVTGTVAEEGSIRKLRSIIRAIH